MKVLIVGRIPPPIGGVSIHVLRLMQHLEDECFDFDFQNLSDGILNLIKVSRRYKLIHLHASSPVLRALFSIYCKFRNKTLIQTYHGNIGRFGFTKNLLDLVSIKFSTIPIVINSASYKTAIQINKNTILRSAYIEPKLSTPLSDEIKTNITKWRTKYQQVFCTNAFSLQYDKHKNEIYSGTLLIDIFKGITNKGLIFSDPSGEYLSHWHKNYGTLPGNVLLITQNHDFFEVLKHSDCFIRATTTDGDSLSVKEALSIGKSVLASDCVERPEGCKLFSLNDHDGLLLSILDFVPEKGNVTGEYNGFASIFEVYLKILENAASDL